jgi:hypothetical protein
MTTAAASLTLFPTLHTRFIAWTLFDLSLILRKRSTHQGCLQESSAANGRVECWLHFLEFQEFHFQIREN